MNIERKIHIHHSSLVGLKAELLRKKIEVEEGRAKLETAQLPRKSAIKKINIKDDCLKAQAKRKQREKLKKFKDIENTKALEKSKLMLQTKSKLYDELSKSHTNINPNFLVDFERKMYYSDHSNRDDNYKSDQDTDCEWVEYTDCFGRARKCLQKDLSNMREKDDFLKKNVMKKTCNNDVREKVPFVEDKTSLNEPEIEIMRRKWEEQASKLTNKNDLHYQDVLFDEARTHGVGYYAFSQDEDERAKQQENLMELRKETEQKQKENQEIHDVKERIQKNRLKVAQMRKRIRVTSLAEEMKEKRAMIPSISSNGEIQMSRSHIDHNETDEIKNKCLTGKIEERETTKNLDNIKNKINTFGELSGKSNQWYIMSQEEWVDEIRKERKADFAPSYKNFQQGEILESNTLENEDDFCLLYSNKFSESNKSNATGSIRVSTNDLDVRIIPPSMMEPTILQSKG